MAANQGNKYGESNLARCYEYGIGVPKDLTEAAKWYQKAAEQGHKTSIQWVKQNERACEKSSVNY
jgi:TPR repeat protein